MDYHFDDFTERNYRKLLETAKTHYTFIRFDEYRSEGKNVLWRHDVDVSIHRAHRLATIEAEVGVKATFFIDLHSIFYNPLEREASDVIASIRELGHDLGLHFDLGYYGLDLRARDRLARLLAMERSVLRELFGDRVSAVSLHAPAPGDLDQLPDSRLGGMVNTYSCYLRGRYGYCSDSNGYWRFRRLKDVLEVAEDDKLQVLLHPEWWTPEAMSPRDRISRCIDGRAKSEHEQYEEMLKKMGHCNVR